jgi:hypothetical protein
MNATYNTTDTRFILFRIADAIEAGVIVLGRFASVGTYRTATGGVEFRIVFYNGTTHDVATDGSINAAHHFIDIEGAGGATQALNSALLRREGR